MQYVDRGGARVGYVNPDQTTFDYLKRPHAPADGDFERATSWWQSMASDSDAVYDDVVDIQGSDIGPTITWGITPGQSVSIDGVIPELGSLQGDERKSVQEALDYMGFAEGQSIAGTPVDVTFVGSCTNGRLSHLRESGSGTQGSQRRESAGCAWITAGECCGRSRRVTRNFFRKQALSGAEQVVQCAWL